MFVGFIAVVVILLVIVGLMSSGATNGSGGVDQTKATKALSEISALVQSTGFFKTTTANSDYVGLNGVSDLVSAGIVASADTYTVVAGDNVKVDGTQVAAAKVLVKSKAVSGLYYDVVKNGTSDASFDLTIAVDSDSVAPASGLAAALEKAYDKLAATSNVSTGDVNNDGSAVVTSK